jgi:hypothetical protein
MLQLLQRALSSWIETTLGAVAVEVGVGVGYGMAEMGIVRREADERASGITRAGV